MVRLLLFGLVLGACGYGARFSDCSVICSNESGCPRGFACIGGVCRSAGATSACVGVDDGSVDTPSDSTVGSDAAQVDALRMITISQTSPDIAVDAGVGCMTGTRQWDRVFPLADFDITDALTITNVSLWIWHAQAAPMVTINVGTYSGMPGGTAYQPTEFMRLGGASVTIPDETSPGTLVSEPIPPTAIPAGSLLAVEVLVPSGGILEIGSIGSTGATAEGYFLCGGTGSQPQSYASGFILTVTGTY